MNKFDYIEYAPLRIWNRCVMLFNIAEDDGVDASKKYLSLFTKEERIEMLHMYEDVKARGRDTVLKDVTRNMPLQDSEDEIDEPVLH